MNSLVAEGSHSPVLLVLENGSCFCGRTRYCGLTRCCGRTRDAACKTFGEIVYNAAMVGYQKLMTNPSRAEQAGQIVALTYSRVGNCGMSALAMQKDGTSLRGLQGVTYATPLPTGSPHRAYPAAHTRRKRYRSTWCAGREGDNCPHAQEAVAEQRCYVRASCDFPRAQEAVEAVGIEGVDTRALILRTRRGNTLARALHLRNGEGLPVHALQNLDVTRGPQTRERGGCS